MNKQELIAAVAAKTGQTKVDTTKVVDAFFETVTEVMAAGNKVVLVGFGSFAGVDRPERMATNPKDPGNKDARIHVPAQRVPKVKLTLKLS